MSEGERQQSMDIHPVDMYRAFGMRNELVIMEIEGHFCPVRVLARTGEEPRRYHVHDSQDRPVAFARREDAEWFCRTASETSIDGALALLATRYSYDPPPSTEGEEEGETEREKAATGKLLGCRAGQWPHVLPCEKCGLEGARYVFLVVGSVLWMCPHCGVQTGLSFTADLPDEERRDLAASHLHHMDAKDLPRPESTAAWAR
jgi:hypothetical protein